MNSDDIQDDVESRMKTLMIGFIDRFEQSFGYLWGHGKPTITDNQELFKDKWLDLRTDLLNYGNYQIRQALNDVKRSFKDTKFKYHYKFINPNFKNPPKDKE